MLLFQRSSGKFADVVAGGNARNPAFFDGAFIDNQRTLLTHIKRLSFFYLRVEIDLEDYKFRKGWIFRNLDDGGRLSAASRAPVGMNINQYRLPRFLSCLERGDGIGLDRACDGGCRYTDSSKGGQCGQKLERLHGMIFQIGLKKVRQAACLVTSLCAFFEGRSDETGTSVPWSIPVISRAPRSNVM